MVAVNNRSVFLSFSCWFVIMFMKSLAIASPVVKKEHHYEEIYIIRDGETLQTISEKCNAPFILIDNPHIQGIEYIFEGVPLKITYKKKEA